jgi:hypothetical protein
VEGRDFASPANTENQPADARPSDKLKFAVRRARLDDAERTKVVSELRGAEIARLEMLRDEILPVAAEIPADIDLFDIGLAATERPRLFIDMIGFIEMGHDRRTYRFIQDTRLGRVVIAESERMEPIVEAVSDYIARRLIEREKALAADGTLERAARAYAETQEKIAARHERSAAAGKSAKKPSVIGRLFAFAVEFLGSALLCLLLALGGFAAWKYAAALWLAKHSGG